MSLDMLDRILDKCTSESKVLLAQLYFYNEPFLIPHLPQMIELCRDYRIPSLVSTNLMLFREDVFASAPDRLIISVSGWTNETHRRGHVGGDIDRVKENMNLAAAKRHPDSEVQVSWHRYRYNEHEMPEMLAYSKALGFSFVPYATSLFPQKLAIKVWQSGIPHPSEDDMLVSVLDAQESCLSRRKWDCSGQDSVIVVDGEGIIINCNGDGFDPASRRGSIFDTTIPGFIRTRKKDPACKACKETGCHIYNMQAWSRSHWSPMRLMGTACRRLGINGYIEPFVRRINYGRKLLPYSK